MWNDYIFLGVDSLLVFAFYKIYKSREAVIKNIVKAPSLAVGPELGQLLNDAGHEGLPYAVVRGRVNPYGNAIDSQSAGFKGVLQIMTLSEHSVRRHAFGRWGETVRVIKQTHNSVPFGISLVSGSDDISIEVENPFDAVMEKFLVPVSTNFTPTTNTVGSSVLGFVTGHATKGVETTEELLPISTVITGIGRVVKDASGHCKICEPVNSEGFPYILSTLPLESIVKRLENRNFYLKAAAYFFATVGVIVLTRKATKWWKVRQAKMMRQNILKHRSKRDLDRLSQAETCVVCLRNPREIYLMDCGHVAVCADCCPKLNDKCPICRQFIRGTHPAFMA